MKVIFVSDAHIKFNESSEDVERRLRFSAFLKTLIGNCDILFLNGDIFDLWVPWKHVVIKEYFSLLSILAEIKDSGSKIIMTAGNHDFWFSDFLRKQIGIQIYPDHYQGEIAGKIFYVSHGDRYTKNDLRYHFFRALVRNRIVKFIFTSLHPDLALDIGIKLSRSSRKRRIPKYIRENMINSLDEAAQKILDSSQNDFVIFSHSHQPVLSIKDNGIYANSGDWVSHSSYLEFIDGELKLKEYK